MTIGSVSDYHLAGGFWSRSIIADSTGWLTELQSAVSRDYAKRRWVARRCEHATSRILAYLQLLDGAAPLHDQVIAWVFGAGITTHVPLVAGLKNPTVRRRYMAVRELLAEYGHMELYESLLELLGCTAMSPAQVEEHLAALTTVFDAASAVSNVPFSFASDISRSSRPIAIDGSRELIEQGFHREAVFWMVVTYSRCQKALHSTTTTPVQDTFADGYRRLLHDLGIDSFADLQQRSVDIKRFLPRLGQTAQAIMAANRGIED